MEIYFGKTVYFDINNLGKQGDSRTSYNHVSCVNDGIIKKFKNSKFTEYVITHDTNNPTITEEGHMGDSLVTVVAILLAAILMFIFPMMAMSERNDDISQLTIQTIIVEFVNNATNTGKITEADYDKLVSELYATGNTYDINIELQVLDENPKNKKGDDTQLLGENIYYSVYTSQIMEDLDANKVKYMKEGDILTVSASNSNNTLSQMFKNFFYSLSGNNTYSITASYSAISRATGNSK